MFPVVTVARDLHGSGIQRLPVSNIIFFATEEEVVAHLFEDKTGFDPRSESCECCGPDFSFSEATDREDIEDILEYAESNSDYEVA